jgi:hypothetical protein
MLAAFLRPTSSPVYSSLRFLSSKVLTATKPNLPYGWPIAERVKYEVAKQDVWTVFSPTSGFVPKVRNGPAFAISQIINLLGPFAMTGFYQSRTGFHELGASCGFTL